MNTLSNIIPNPLSINKTLNSNYSNSRFATSDMNGKSNTEVISKYKDNIIPSKMPQGFYLGGIGEIGLIMENVDYINNIIKKYNGTQISLNDKFASSTFYNNLNVSEKKYKIINDLNNIWYYDTTYGMISYSSIYEAYKSFPIYKYNIKDFDSTEDDYDIKDDDSLYLDANKTKKFRLLDYFYYCQDDIFDNLENTSSFVFFDEDYLKSKITYDIGDNISNYLDVLTTNEATGIFENPIEEFKNTDQYGNEYYDWDAYYSQEIITTVTAEFKRNSKYIDDGSLIYVYDNISNKYLEIKIKNIPPDVIYNDNISFNIQDNGGYIVYFEKDNTKYWLSYYKTNYNSNEIPLSFLSEYLSIDYGEENNLINLNKTSDQSGNKILVYLPYYQNDSDKKMQILDKKSLFKYPIYYRDNIYSFPLLPSNKNDNYYDCEFYVIIPRFYIISEGRSDGYDISNINSNIKISLKFGDGEIKEVLSPFIKLKDAVVYKFKKIWLFEHMYISNQELVISLIDNSKDSTSDKVLYSIKVYFNLFELSIIQGKFQDVDCKVRYSNYYPLKYPVNTGKKFIELNYIPIDNINEIDESTLENAEIIPNTRQNSDNIVQNVNTNKYLININDLANNYSYLKTNIYQSLNTSYNMIDWFLVNNANGLRIGNSPELIDNSYSMFEFYLSNHVKTNLKIDNISIYYKNFTYYDNDGILGNYYFDDSETSNIVKDVPTSYNSDAVASKYTLPIYGMKEILYLPYEFNIGNVWNSENCYYTNTKTYTESGILNTKSTFSIFEDFLIILNNSGVDANINFVDESLTLCEGTRTIKLKNNEIRVYKPSKHMDYNIILKTIKLNSYKLKLYKIYEPFLNNTQRVNNVINKINEILNSNNKPQIIKSIIGSDNLTDGEDIVTIPIYDYRVPLFGNIVIINPKT